MRLLILFVAIATSTVASCSENSIVANVESNPSSGCESLSDSEEDIDKISNLIILYEEKGRYREAAECIERLVYFGYDMPPNLAEISIFRAKSGDCDKARKGFVKYLVAMSSRHNMSAKEYSETEIIEDPVLERLKRALVDNECDPDVGF